MKRFLIFAISIMAFMPSFSQDSKVKRPDSYNYQRGVEAIQKENSEEYRTGTVIFKEDNVSTTIYITQGGLCNNCHGNGENSCVNCLGMGGSGYGMFYSQCFWCGGSGKIKCGVCGGSGTRE